MLLKIFLPVELPLPVCILPQSAHIPSKRLSVFCEILHKLKIWKNFSFNFTCDQLLYVIVSYIYTFYRDVRGIASTVEYLEFVILSEMI